jgi:hypothetical protein
VKWTPNQPSHGFWPGQSTSGDDKVFAVVTNARKLASRALGDIFSGDRASKMGSPAEIRLNTVAAILDGPSSRPPRLLKGSFKC